MNELPIWRQAIQDEQHPLHRAAWMLFSPSLNAPYAAQALADQREAVLDFINTILDTEELYLDSSLGKGFAPPNAVRLLGEWRVTDAIPRLMRILKEEDWETAVYDSTLTALGKMGEAAVEPLLEFGEQTSDVEQRVTIASILGDAGRGSSRAFEFIRRVFERQKSDMDISYLAEHLLTCDAEAGSAYLEDWMKKHRVSKWTRDRLNKLLADTRAGKS
jgi:HEAT repeat protein